MPTGFSEPRSPRGELAVALGTKEKWFSVQSQRCAPKIAKFAEFAKSRKSRTRTPRVRGVGWGSHGTQIADLSAVSHFSPT